MVSGKSKMFSVPYVPLSHTSAAGCLGLPGGEWGTQYTKSIAHALGGPKMVKEHSYTLEGYTRERYIPGWQKQVLDQSENLVDTIDTASTNRYKLIRYSKLTPYVTNYQLWIQSTTPHNRSQHKQCSCNTRSSYYNDTVHNNNIHNTNEKYMASSIVPACTLERYCMADAYDRIVEVHLG